MLQVIGLNPHVGVGLEDDVVARGRQGAHEVRDLGIQPGVGIGMDKGHRHLRVSGSDFADHGDSRVLRVGAGEDDLEGRRIALREVALEIGRERFVGALQRLDHGHGRKVACRLGRRFPHMPNGVDRAQQVEARSRERQRDQQPCPGLEHAVSLAPAGVARGFRFWLLVRS